jgi:hypothetical protein
VHGAAAPCQPGNDLQEAIDERQLLPLQFSSTCVEPPRETETQQKRIDSWIKQRAATQECIIFFYTDGYEYALTPAKYLSTRRRRCGRCSTGKARAGIAERGKSDIYRLVRTDNYAVLMLVKEVWTPVWIQCTS